MGATGDLRSGTEGGIQFATLNERTPTDFLKASTSWVHELQNGGGGPCIGVIVFGSYHRHRWRVPTLRGPIASPLAVIRPEERGPVVRDCREEANIGQCN